MPFSNRYNIYIQLIWVLLFSKTDTIAQQKMDKSAVLYGIFNNEATMETRIIPIFSEGLIEIPAQSNGFQILPNNNIPISEEWYGSATLAVDPRSGLFYYASKSVEQQRFWAISQNGKQTHLSLEAHQMSGHSLTKMAMGPDGYVYALSTDMKSRNRERGKETLLIRFKACNSPGCTSIEKLGYVSGKDGYLNSLIYSGDMAFSSSGDLFLFGTEIDTTINYYKGAHIFKISSCEIKQGKNFGPIRIAYMGQIAGMGVKTGIDSTIVTGVAFEKDGSFILSTIDKYSGSRVHFYRGSIQQKITWVKPLRMKYNIPAGFKISDLASFNMPVVSILTSKKQPEEKITTSLLADNWEKNVTITKYNY